jgi:hypothetical protein
VGLDPVAKASGDASARQQPGVARAEGVTGVRGGPLVDRKLTVVGDVPEDERVGRRRRDPVGTGQGFGPQHPVDRIQVRVAAPDGGDERDDPPDELAREPAGPERNDEKRPVAARGRVQVPDGAGLVGREVVEVVFAGQQCQGIAGPVVVESLPGGVAGGVQVIDVGPGAGVVGRVEAGRDVGARPRPDRIGEFAVERPTGSRRGVSQSGASRATVWARAETPASVRPAAAYPSGFAAASSSTSSARNASKMASSTVGTSGWRWNPWNGRPS